MSSVVLTREQSRALDQHAIEQYGISSLVLMENAGRGCVDVLERLGIDGPVAIICGKGNNGGDGFVIARHLDIRGYKCRVVLVGDPEDLRGDAAANFALVRSRKIDVEVSYIPAPDSRHLAGQLDFHAGDATWRVDALLGTGARGEPKPPYDTAIDWFNVRDSKTRVLAVDVPSGLDCDTGQPAKHTVRADHTCTFAALKVGFLQPAARPFTGTVHVCDIGVPQRLIAEILEEPADRIQQSH